MINFIHYIYYKKILNTEDSVQFPSYNQSFFTRLINEIKVQSL
jgi:hypothetical protein